MSQRFYQVELKERPAYWGDLGNNLTITGLIIEGEGSSITVMTPFTSLEAEKIKGQEIVFMTDEEFSELIANMDDPKIFERDEKGRIKTVHRKVRYSISGSIQQRVWARDGFKCVFCNKKMGSVQLTVDHFMPLELGGVNDPTNYLSACRKCNKRKGARHPIEFCLDNGHDYDAIVDYLKRVKI